jgi:hypothetical protein
MRITLRVIRSLAFFTSAGRGALALAVSAPGRRQLQGLPSQRRPAMRSSPRRNRSSSTSSLGVIRFSYDLTPVDLVLHGRNRLRSTIDWAKRLAKLQSEETAIA